MIDPATKAPYNGDAPYFVIALDGATRDGLKGFTPLAATADMLSTFFNIKDGGSIPVADVLDVFKAATDVAFGKRALALKAQMADAPPTQDMTPVRQQLDANLADIVDPELARVFRMAQPR